MTMVWMYNSETEGYAQVDPEALSEVWEDLGWTQQDPPAETTPPEYQLSPEEEAMENVWMYNPDTEGYAQVHPQAFEETWAEKGWIQQDPEGSSTESVTKIDIFHMANGWFANVPEEAFTADWEPNGWVRAPHDEDGTPVPPPEYVPSDTGSE